MKTKQLNPINIILLFLAFLLNINCNKNNEPVWESDNYDHLYFYPKKVLINFRLYNYKIEDSLINIYSDFSCKDTLKIKYTKQNDEIELKYKNLYKIGLVCDSILKYSISDEVNKIDYQYFYYKKAINKDQIIGKWKYVDDDFHYEFLDKESYTTDDSIKGKYIIDGSVIQMGDETSCFRFSTYKIVYLSRKSLILNDCRNNLLIFKKIKS
jgi:hypothetical protein